MSRPKPLSGFPEYTPEARIVEQFVLDRLRETFELHGFASIETRAVEPLDRLAKQGEIDKEVYTVQRLHRDPDEPESYLNKGMATLRLPNGWDEAVPLFDTAIAKETRRPAIAYYGRAVANELGGNLRQAYRDYREASRIDPEWQDPQKELARFTVRRN